MTENKPLEGYGDPVISPRSRRVMSTSGGYLVVAGQAVAIYGVTPSGTGPAYYIGLALFGVGWTLTLLATLTRFKGSGQVGYPPEAKKRAYCGLFAQLLPIVATLIIICSPPVGVMATILALFVAAEKLVLDRSH